jgi:peptidoglycan/xylan/chitin deacetylase (PgdA/CDA1 family)
MPVAALLSPYRLLSPGGATAKLDIFIFHRVYPRLDAMAPGEPDVARFERLIRFLCRAFTLLPLAEAAERLAAGTLPAAAACITFDDGYADNLTLAAPILARFAAPATIFVATGYLDGGRMWNDTVIESIRRTSVENLDLADLGLPVLSLKTLVQRRHAIGALLPIIKYRPVDERISLSEAIAYRARVNPPSDLMLTTPQLRELAAARNITIGAHTRRHPILACASAGEAETEIAGSRADLQALLQKDVNLFAYPNGRPDKDYRAEHVEMVRRAGFRHAVSTAPGVASALADPLQLPRFTPWAQSMPKFGLQLARALWLPPAPRTLEVAA